MYTQTRRRNPELQPEIQKWVNHHDSTEKMKTTFKCPSSALAEPQAMGGTIPSYQMALKGFVTRNAGLGRRIR
jgi:hypothetical protein